MLLLKACLTPELALKAPTYLHEVIGMNWKQTMGKSSFYRGWTRGIFVR
jgi:hypothetical protein